MQKRQKTTENVASEKLSVSLLSSDTSGEEVRSYHSWDHILTCAFFFKSGELYRKGDRGFRAESGSVKSIFFPTGLHILGLDFRLFVCEGGVKQIIELNQCCD